MRLIFLILHCLVSVAHAILWFFLQLFILMLRIVLLDR